MNKKIGLTEVVLRDGNQSLLSTRLKIDDLLPIASKLDQIGYSSIESWGGAVFDSCVRYLNEDPWERLREFKKAMPNTKQQMLLRGQNLVGYRHYSDEIVSVDRDTGKKQLYVLLTKLAGAIAKGNTPLKVVTNRIMPHINRGSPIIILSPLEDDPTIVDAVRDLRARNFDVTVLSPSSLEFEFDAKRLDRTGYEVLKTERDILMSELRGLGAFVMDWEPDMMLNTALAGARGF